MLPFDDFVSTQFPLLNPLFSVKKKKKQKTPQGKAQLRVNCKRHNSNIKTKIDESERDGKRYTMQTLSIKKLEWQNLMSK